MRNIKNLHIFHNYVIKEKRNSQGHFGNVKNKGQCNPKVTLELYICNFLTWEKGQNISSQAFSWSVNESGLFSSFSLVLWVVSSGSICWFDFILLISICILFSFSLSNVDHFECSMCCEMFPSACQTLRWLSNKK